MGGLKSTSCCIVLLLAPLILAIPSLIMAADDHYTCTIVTASRLTDKGTLAQDEVVKHFLGNEFTVDRVTGRITGGPLDNREMTIQLIARGTHDMSSEVFAVSKETLQTTHIRIDQFLPTEHKPFMGTTTLYYPGVYSGLCK